MNNSKKPKTVFLVDDEDFVLDIYSKKLKQQDINVICSKNGEEMIEKLLSKETRPDMILLDIIMPKMDGLETLKRAHEENLLDNIIVIMLTNQGNDQIINISKKLNIHGFIVKSSYSPTEVIEEILRIYTENI